jgi:hypothetical protein
MERTERFDLMGELKLYGMNPRSHRLRNPGQLPRRERYRQNPPLKGVKIGRQCGVNIGRRLTTDVRMFEAELSAGLRHRDVDIAIEDCCCRSL